MLLAASTTAALNQNGSEIGAVFSPSGKSLLFSSRRP
jgi:hypothetical protein